jgi:hypothetical protein
MALSSRDGVARLAEDPSADPDPRTIVRRWRESSWDSNRQFVETPPTQKRPGIYPYHRGGSYGPNPDSSFIPRCTGTTEKS